MYIKYNKLVCIILSLTILCFLVALCPLNARTLSAISTYSSTAFNVTVTNDNRMSDDYLNSDGDSYGATFDTSKMKLTVQIYSLNNALIASQTFSTLTTTTVDMGANLATNTSYRVKIIAPTYMRYTVTHTLTSSVYNEYTSNTFTIYNSGTQSIELDFLGIQDDSWQTFYK